METKMCMICGETKPVEEFSKAYKNICKQCRNDMARESRSESKQRIPTPLTELVEKNIQEQRRWQAVLAAIPALIERKETINENEIAMYACDIADAVVREFEKRKGE